MFDNYNNPSSLSTPLYNNTYFSPSSTSSFPISFDKASFITTPVVSSPSQIVPPSSWFDPQQMSYVYSPYPAYPVVWLVKNEDQMTGARESEVPRTPSPCPVSTPPTVVQSSSGKKSASPSPVPSPVSITSIATVDKRDKDESCILLREVLTDELLKLPQATVAERLGINSSSFSKKWKREFPGKSWPHRKHKKIDIQLQMLYNRLPYVTSSREKAEIQHLKAILEEKMRKNLRRPYEDKPVEDDSAKAESKKGRVPNASSSSTKAQRVAKKRKVEYDEPQFVAGCLDPTL